MGKRGETNTNSKGERFIIDDYRSATDVTVVFEVDNSRKQTTYAQVKTGHVSREGAETEEYWVGTKVEDSDGEECTIVEVDSDENVTVQYADGEIVSDLTLKQVMVESFNRSQKQIPAAKAGIESERRRTQENIEYCLKRFRRSVFIRPCGFGKTKIGLKLFYSPAYKKCLFLHPLNDDENARIIKNSKSKKRIDARTYDWLIRLSKEQIKELDYDIVFCDEVHCLGGNEDGKGAYKRYTAMKLFMESHPQTHFVGATATPFRMDGINVISSLFHNHVCYPYTEEDAFEDGILKSPKYFYCTYNVVKKIQDKMNKMTAENLELSRDELQRVLKLSSQELNEHDAELMDQHIKEICDKNIPDTTHMGFIAFYLSNAEIAENREKVLNWFRKAYPEHEIEDIIITNRSNKSIDEADAMLTKPLDPRYKGRIDIIFNCEKLCMAYHSELITGLILDRKTRSISKYMQMLGRILSCDDNEPKIIFDIVDNIHSDFVYTAPKEVYDKPVIPEFNKEPRTFAEIIAKYPYARHWDEIKRVNKKARKAEKLITDYEKTVNHNYEPQIFDDPAANPLHKATETEKADLTEALKQAQQIIEEKNLSVVDTFNLLAGIQDEYGTLSPEDVEAIEDVETALAHNVHTEEIDSIEDQKETKEPTVCPATFNNPDIAGINARADIAPKKAESQKPASEDKGDPLGYNPTYIYDPNTKALYSRHFDIQNKRANFEADITEAIRTYMAEASQKEIEKVINEWHKINACCKDNFVDYSEVDKTSLKYKLLRSCSEYVHGIPVEKTLLYMIEGKIA